MAASVDIWSIGVIAFELLTREFAFPIDDMHMSAAEPESLAQKAIAGRALLPWEGSSETTQQRLQKLHGLKRTVMRCLDRGPANRATAAALSSSWDHAFDYMRTQGTTFWSADSPQLLVPTSEFACDRPCMAGNWFSSMRHALFLAGFVNPILQEACNVMSLQRP